MEPLHADDIEETVIEEILAFLQEKRTALEAIRIGIAIIVAQTSMIGLLIVASKYYVLLEVMHLLVPFVFLNVLLFGIAVYFIIRSLVQIHHLDRLILKHRKTGSRIGRLMV
jgi:hypothetical protein